MNNSSLSHILFRDEDICAFLDIHPVSRGHVLIIPVQHYENIFDIPEEVLAKINILAKRVATRQKNNLGASGVNILHASGKEAQQSVFHLHYHVVPRYQDDGLNLWFHQEASDTHSNEEIIALLTKDPL